MLARTTVGEIGVLPGHEPTLAQLEEAGVVRIDGADGSSTTVAVHGGFLHITAGRGDGAGGVRRAVHRDRRVAGPCRPGPGRRVRTRGGRSGGPGERAAEGRRRRGVAGAAVGPMAVIVGILLLVFCLLPRLPAFRRVRLMRGGGVDVCLRRRPGPASGLRAPDGTSASGATGATSSRGTGSRASARGPPSCSTAPSSRSSIGAPPDLPRPTRSRRALRCCAAGQEGRSWSSAMTPGVLTGFLSWLEASPPGRSTGYRQAS